MLNQDSDIDTLPEPLFSFVSESEYVPDNDELRDDNDSEGDDDQLRLGI